RSIARGMGFVIHRQMRFSLIMFAAGIAMVVGCAAKPQAATREKRPLDVQYEDASVAALVFDPPVSMNEPTVELDREPRQASAFVGYEELSTTFFYVRNDDRWRTDGLDRFERRAISERTGVS